MVAVTTPFDDDIARASAEIGATMITYGAPERQEEARGKVSKAALAPASVAADRAAYNLASGGKAIQGSGDLVADAREGKVDMEKLKKDELPAEMQSMSAPQRKAYVEQQAQKREALNGKLAELAKKRADYVQAEQKRLAAAGRGDSFDLKVTEIVSEQAARVR
jgi:hypothetical protein